MASGSQKNFFVRDASGLVREVSTAKALFFNVAAVVGNGAALTPAYPVLFPIAIILGLPLFSWAVTISGLFGIAYLLCLAVLSQVMPRTGGDYVYSSRITHPFVGWLEGWTLIFAAASTIGYNGWGTVYGLGVWFKAGSILSNQWFNIGKALTQVNSLLLLGTVMFAVVIVISLLSTKMFHNIVTILAIVSMVATFVQLVPLIGVTSDTFASNFQALTGMTEQQVIGTATAQGWTNTWFNWPGVAALLGFTLFVFIGYTNSTFLAGELKGNIQKNVVVSTLMAMLFQAFTAFYILPFINVGGYQFINAWSYLFWNAPSLAPLQGPPITTLLAVIASPQNAWLILTVGFPIIVVFNFLVPVAWGLTLVRVIFAQTMDRFFPAKLAEVSERTKQPTYATLLMAVVGYAFLAVAVSSNGGAAATIWFTVILGFLGLLMPAVNCILLKWRRPDFFESAPSWARRRVAGLPVMVWLGVIWLLFLIPIFSVVDGYGLITSLLSTPSSQLLSYIFSSGLSLAGVLIFIGIVWYFGAKYYNRRRGIDTDLIFKSLPPE